MSERPAASFLLLAHVAMGAHCNNTGMWNAVSCRTGKNCSYINREHDCSTQLVCVKGVCQQCTADAECDRGAEQVCRRVDSYYVCSHKDMLPLDARDIAGLAMAFVASALAAGGGIGGGGLLVPLFVLLLEFTPHDATPLSNAAIFGGALANLGLNLRRSNPSGRGALRPLISFEVALMLEPMTIAGAILEPSKDRC